MTLTQPKVIGLIIKSGEVAMKNAAHYRALASLCRQSAVYNPDKSWRLLGQAERWEHLAQEELASHFVECNGNRPAYTPESQTTENANGPRWKTIAAA